MVRKGLIFLLVVGLRKTDDDAQWQNAFSKKISSPIIVT